MATSDHSCRGTAPPAFGSTVTIFHPFASGITTRVPVFDCRNRTFFPSAAAAHLLPPKGPPGIKGRKLRAAVGKALSILAKQGQAGLAEATAILSDAQTAYDANEA